MGLSILHNEPLELGVKRVLAERLHLALQTLQLQTTQDKHKAVHESRKRIKEMRGILRLIAKEVEKKEWKTLQKHLRQAAHILAPLRDADSQMDTFRKVEVFFAASNQSQTIRPFLNKAYKKIKQHRKELTAQSFQNPQTDILKQAHQKLALLQEKFHQITFSKHSADIFFPNLETIYGQAQKHLRKALEEDSSYQWHEFRKYVKYLWYQVQVLEQGWTNLLRPLGEELKTVASLLGEEHDLYLLIQNLEQIKTQLPSEGAETIQHLQNKILLHQIELRQKAAFLGKRLFAEKSKAFAARLVLYWTM
ncbi:CHAD domain-containing protein [Hugenholtzia roseola]|uniref:CHAD domain-containing protein n=1 Tax=Hugenholtzia roseola TaxID=1002 RepID=UPI00040A3673|nr:CHAD domain-containing protein [Hugenholtzia roseola]